MASRSGRLDGRVAVVVGGGRGIGRATAVCLAQAGARVIVSSRSRVDIQAAAEEASAAGGVAEAVPADVAEWQDVRVLEERTREVFGPADVVVFTAGIVDPVGYTWMVPPGDWAHNLSVNLLGCFHVARAFLPSMVQSRAGILIFVSSGAAVHTVPAWGAYACAKAGLDHFVRNLADELDMAGIRVRVHTVYPGVVDTSMQERVRATPEEVFPLVERYRDYYRKGWLRPPADPATLIWWLTTPMAADLHGLAANIDDPEIRERVSADLGVPILRGRGG